MTNLDVKPGQRVEPATALLVLVQTDKLWLQVQVPANDASRWQPGTHLKLRGRDITARVLSTGSEVAADSQTVALRAVVDTAASGLRPGEVVAVELPAAVAHEQEGWSIPLSAVAYEGKQAFVFVRVTDGFEARPVAVVASAGQRLRVQGVLKDPLKAGEQIAVSGIVALKGAWLKDKPSDKGGE